jgi:hypothetical protein
MTDQTVIEQPKPKRKYMRRKHVSVNPPIIKPSPYEGMTASSCADACRPERCVVSHKPFCGHPYIGQRTQQSLQRYNEAKTRLAHMRIDKQKG